MTSLRGIEGGKITTQCGHCQYDEVTSKSVIEITESIYKHLGNVVSIIAVHNLVADTELLRSLDTALTLYIPQVDPLRFLRAVADAVRDASLDSRATTGEPDLQLSCCRRVSDKALVLAGAIDKNAQGLPGTHSKAFSGGQERRRLKVCVLSKAKSAGSVGLEMKACTDSMTRMAALSLSRFESPTTNPLTGKESAQSKHLARLKLVMSEERWCPLKDVYLRGDEGILNKLHRSLSESELGTEQSLTPRNITRTSFKTLDGSLPRQAFTIDAEKLMENAENVLEFLNICGILALNHEYAWSLPVLPSTPITRTTPTAQSPSALNRGSGLTGATPSGFIRLSSAPIKVEGRAQLPFTHADVRRCLADAEEVFLQDDCFQTDRHDSASQASNAPSFVALSFKGSERFPLAVGTSSPQRLAPTDSSVTVLISPAVTRTARPRMWLIYARNSDKS